jgi:hypothetical protein
MDLTKFNNLIPFVLEFIVMIIKNEHFLSIPEFDDKIKPHLKSILKAKEIPAQALFLIISNL